MASAGRCAVSLFGFKTHLAMAAASVLLFVGQPKASQVDDLTLVKIETGEEVLLLPDPLERLIAERYPGYRVPDTSDVTGLWARAKTPGTFPFAVWGDFNGDSLQDAGLILLGKTTFRIVIFNKTQRGYVLALEMGDEFDAPPAGVPFYQRLLIRMIPRGKIVEFNPGENAAAGEGVFRFHAQHDSIMVNVFDELKSIIAWRDGAYQHVFFGSSL